MPIHFTSLPEGLSGKAHNDASLPCYVITGSEIQVHNISQLSSGMTSTLRESGFSFSYQSYSFCAPFSEEREKSVKEVLSLKEPTDEWDPRVCRDYALALKARLADVEMDEKPRAEILHFVSSLVEDGGVIGIPDGPSGNGQSPEPMNLYRTLIADGVKVTINAMPSRRELRPYMGFVKSVWCDGADMAQPVLVCIIRMYRGEPIIENVPIQEVVEQENLLDFVIANIL